MSEDAARQVASSPHARRAPSVGHFSDAMLAACGVIGSADFFNPGAPEQLASSEFPP